MPMDTVIGGDERGSFDFVHRSGNDSRIICSKKGNIEVIALVFARDRDRSLGSPSPHGPNPNFSRCRAPHCYRLARGLFGPEPKRRVLGGAGIGPLGQVGPAQVHSGPNGRQLGAVFSHVVPQVRCPGHIHANAPFPHFHRDRKIQK
ncbi:hypothetical protein JHK84_033838 [Glycine max]|nr:hypothetical protein JHK85_034219 [Glycine max]KAG5140070.1 hypothetical protein JHK84_033838 [Glycine max]